MIQRACEESTSEDLWPWRYRDRDITSGEQAPDVGNIDQVVFDGKPLVPTEHAYIRDTYPGSDGTLGAPRYYWWTNERLGTFPRTEATLRLYYYSTWNWYRHPDEPDDLQPARTASNDASKPICPPEWRDLIVELACTYGQADSEDYDERNANRDQYEARLDAARRALFSRINDEPRRIRVISGEDWA